MEQIINISNLLSYLAQNGFGLEVFPDVRKKRMGIIIFTVKDGQRYIEKSMSTSNELIIHAPDLVDRKFKDSANSFEKFIKENS